MHMVDFTSTAMIPAQTFTFGFSATGLAVGGKMNALPNLGRGEVKVSSFYKRTEVLQLSRKKIPAAIERHFGLKTAVRSTPVSQWQKQPCAAVELCRPCAHDHSSASFFNPGHFFLIANFFLFRILTSGWHILPACRKCRVTCLSFFFFGIIKQCYTLFPMTSHLSLWAPTLPPPPPSPHPAPLFSQLVFCCKLPVCLIFRQSLSFLCGLNPWVACTGRCGGAVRCSGLRSECLWEDWVSPFLLPGVCEANYKAVMVL